MNKMIFVYGSLMAGLKTEMNRYFHQNSTFIGEGYLQGRLYDVGHYPGAIYDQHSPDKVFGHVFALKNPEKVLLKLDEYENVGQRYGQYDEYIRKECPIEMNGAITNCWIYLYNHSVEKLPTINSGNYLENLKNNPSHQQFLKSV